MTITFFSNFLNHHQLPFCQAMYDRLGSGFRFIAVTPPEQEQLKLGYSDMNKKYPFVLTTYDSEDNKKEALKLALESDAVITGGMPSILFFDRERIRRRKLTFKSAESICKKGRWTLFLPPRLYSIIKRYVDYKNNNLYLLCSSAYAAGEFALIGAYKHKTYKWGYFTEVKSYDVQELFKKKEHNITEILWAGRFLRWKHPEKAIYIARSLRRDNYKFKIKMIGIGAEENKIKKLIKEYKLDDCIELLGAMPPEKVREHMERANIFLFTSDYHEGWGAVLNEAMNSACAVVASHAAGSTPYLVKHGENGLVYKNNISKDLYKQLKTLMDSKELREKLSKNAYATMSEEWNAENAAEKFIELCQKKLRDNSYAGAVGTEPCSIALPTMRENLYSMMTKGKDV